MLFSEKIFIPSGIFKFQKNFSMFILLLSFPLTRCLMMTYLVMIGLGSTCSRFVPSYNLAEIPSQ